MAALSDQELQVFVSLLQAINGNDNALRKQAEATYEQTRSEHPDKLVLALTTVMTHAQSAQGQDDLRHAASVFLYKCCRRSAVDGESTMGKVTAAAPEMAAQIRQQMLTLLNNETSSIVSHKLAEACGELGCQLAPKNAWPQLMEAVKAWAGGDVTKKEIAFRVLNEMAADDAVAESLMEPATKQFMASLLQQGLAEASAAVQCQAISLIFVFVENEVETKSLQGLIPQITSVLKNFCQTKAEKELGQCLQTMVQLIDPDQGDCAGFFKAHVPALFEMNMLIARAKDQLEDDSRRLAFEFLMSYVESKPKMCMKIPSFVPEMFKLCMEFMLELDDDPDWEKQGDEEEDDDRMNYDVGLENVDRFAKALETDQLLAVFPLVAAYMQQTWKHKVVGLMTLSQLAESLEDEGQVDQIVQQLVASFSDPHPRVRYAALHALGQTATDQQPYVQEKHGEMLVPKLIQCMDDPVDRVKSHACAAFVNLGEELEQEVMMSNMEALMAKLSALLGGSTSFVRKQAITAVAVIAGVAEENFLPYYPHVVPGLKHIIASCLNKDQQELRGKAFECISLIGMSVGKATFAPDCEPVMTAMVQHLATVEADDPQKSYIEEAVNRIARCMKEDFLRYVPSLLANCIKNLAQKAQAVDPDTLDDNDEDQTVTFLKDGSCVGLKTTQIEDIQAQINMIACFVEVLKEKYFEHIPTTAKAVVDLLEFAFDNDIRETAIDTWAGLMKGLRVGLEQRGQDKQPVGQMLRELLQKVVPVLEEESDPEQVGTVGTSLALCIKEADPNTLTEQEVGHLVTVVGKLLEESFERRSKLLKKAKKGELDEDDEERVQAEKENDEVARNKLVEVCGALMKTHKAHFLKVGMAPWGALLQKLVASKAEGDNRLAIYVGCDFLEHLQSDSVQAWVLLLPQVLAGLKDMKDDELRQGCAYAIQCAASIPEFAQHAGAAANEVAEVIQHPKSKKKDKKLATENCVAALLFLCLKHPTLVQPGHWDLWLQQLPIVYDEEEGQKCHKQLLQLIASQHQFFQQPDKLARALEVLALVYKTDAVDDETNEGTKQVFKQLGAQVEQLAAGWTDKAKKRAKRVVREAQQ